MELRAARAAARRRVSAYTTTVTMAGLALLVLAAPAAARVAGRDPEPVLLLAALVLAAELMPLELGRPGTRDSTTMSQPFAFALVLGWGTPAGVVALGACSALADLLGGKAARKVLFNSAQLAIASGPPAWPTRWPAATPTMPGCRCPPWRPSPWPSSWSTTCWWRRCWCWPGAPRPWAGSARGWACGPGCRPCCWGWRRWSR